jgi:hypothetical protein
MLNAAMLIVFYTNKAKVIFLSGRVENAAFKGVIATIGGEDQQLADPLDDKTIFHRVHPNLWIVFHCSRGGEQEQHTAVADGVFCQLDQLFADAFFLIFFSDGQVGKITAVVKVRQCARDTYQ